MELGYFDEASLVLNMITHKSTLWNGFFLTVGKVVIKMEIVKCSMYCMICGKTMK